MTDRKQRGITLVEILIVIVILGIFVALVIPRLKSYSISSKQKEAKEVLSQVYNMQKAYQQQFNSYCLNRIVADSSEANRFAFKKIGVEIPLTARYFYSMDATENTFLCTATANLDADKTSDVWQIDQTGALTSLSDDVVD